MAKKIKLNVSFALTAGASTDVVEALEQAREELRVKVAKTSLEDVLKEGAGGHHLVLMMVDEAVDIEQVFQETVKLGVRELLKELNESDRQGNFQRIGDISVKVVS